jgi:hypothetical protein
VCGVNLELDRLKKESRRKLTGFAAKERAAVVMVWYDGNVSLTSGGLMKAKKST